MQNNSQQIDINKFKCYRFPNDGSIYYGDVSFISLKNGSLVNSIEGMDEEAKKTFKLVRHGYGLQIFNGSRNSDGIMTKYEGRWDRDKKQGEGLAVFKDGSIYNGSFKKDHFEGQGKFEWALGHVYEGQWKESQMDGNGVFNNANGTMHSGVFKRNHYLQDKCFINPLDDEKKQKRNIKVFEEQVISVKEKHAYDKRMRLYRIQNHDQLIEALRETRSMNRVPLFVRTPMSNLGMQDAIDRFNSIFHLPEESLELNLRKIFSDSFGNPIKKGEQREKLNVIVKKAILEGKLLLLNFDDFNYPEQILQAQQQIGMQNQEQPQQAFAVGYDPNIKEFSGTKAIPHQLWFPNQIGKSKELMEQIGLISPEDELIPELQDQVHFAVWSNFKIKGKAAQKEIVNTVVGQQQDDMNIEVTQETIQNAYRFDENQLSDIEILEKVEKRFGKALPLDCINLVLLMEMN